MSRYAFTLIEVIVVVVVIGILAAVVVPKFANAQHDSVVAATAEDLHVIETAVQMYHAKNGVYPADVNRTKFPTVLDPYFKTDNPFAKPAPIGGKYDYEGTPNWNPVQISIRTESEQIGHSEADALALDEYMDDGDLSTGSLRRDGNRTYYIIGSH
ncbi:MAG: prepilin-type N-terminal cleavage/methylation domain-containing protein [Phycisphaerales bacterium]|nr:prepilin-type N-terminal cleavage/methylation domain-containing protein [Phycisphaerales bacterium]